MKKTILEIYALAVCFLTLIIFIFLTGGTVFDVIAINNPSFTIDSKEHIRLQNNDSFWNGCGIGRYCGPEDKKKELPNENELTKQRDEAYAIVLANEQRNKKQDIARTLINMFILTITFLIHWSIARRARANCCLTSQ